DRLGHGEERRRRAARGVRSREEHAALGARVSAGPGAGEARGGPWAHMRALWPRYTLLPTLPFLAFVLYRFARHELRWEHVAMMTAVVVFAYGTKATKKLFVGSYPMILVGLFYDL